jgi:hypothetical protein
MTTAAIPEQPSTFARIRSFVRFWIHVRANVTVVLANQASMAQALNNSVAHINRLNARVSWYERRVPMIAKEYLAFRHHEQKLIESAAANQDYAEREARRSSEQQPTPQLEVVGR